MPKGLSCLAAWVVVIVAGCGDAAPPATVAPQPSAVGPASGDTAAPRPKKPVRPRQPRVDKPLVDPDSPLADAIGNGPDRAGPNASSRNIKPPVPQVATRPIDKERLSEQGIRELKGQYLTLFTDLPAGPDVDELPAVFDAAVPQWQKYFEITEDSGWRATAFLAADKQRFWLCGLWDDDLPEFPSGYTRGREFWMLEQPNAYYRRHLMLHEGTHAFMFAHVSDVAPPWYNEGMAEYFGTHLWADGQLTTGYFPKSREELPLWGRVKLVKDAYAARQGLTFPKVLALGPRAHLVNESYGWSWGAGAFLDGHPRYRDRFRQMFHQARQSNFNQLLQEAYGDEWGELLEEWQVFVANIDYGYDFERMAVRFEAGQPLPAKGATVRVAADAGWQSTGIHLERNKAYRVEASGRYQLKQQPQAWWSEPGGVSIHYFRGSPLGILQAAVRPDEVDPNVTSALLQYDNVGLFSTLLPTHDGTLYLRINDSPAALADNTGTAEVSIREIQP
ncbi:MAG: hypothetical protein AB7I37_15240 [Pirellulales bacterium]